MVGVGISTLVFVAWSVWVVIPPFFDLASRVSAPVWSAGDHAMLVASLGMSGITSSGSLAAEHEALKAQVQALQNENSALREQAYAYTELLTRFGRSLNDVKGGILAGVLSTPPQSLYDTIVIDAGLGSGVTEGMLAYTNANMPIGVVARVNVFSSVVELLSSPGKRFEVVVGTVSDVRAIAEGQGGGNFIIRLPRDTAVAAGDPVALPTLLPEVIGYVAVIDVVPTDSFQTIHFRLDTSLQHLQFVMLRSYGVNIFVSKQIPAPAFSEVGTGKVAQ
jgi:cell shape-determining protein MreC